MIIIFGFQRWIFHCHSTKLMFALSSWIVLAFRRVAIELSALSTWKFLPACIGIVPKLFHWFLLCDFKRLGLCVGICGSFCQRNRTNVCYSVYARDISTWKRIRRVFSLSTWNVLQLIWTHNGHSMLNWKIFIPRRHSVWRMSRWELLQRNH
jgi:hypothetical protein